MIKLYGVSGNRRAAGTAQGVKGKRNYLITWNAHTQQDACTCHTLISNVFPAI